MTSVAFVEVLFVDLESEAAVRLRVIVVDGSRPRNPAGPGLRLVDFGCPAQPLLRSTMYRTLKNYLPLQTIRYAVGPFVYVATMESTEYFLLLKAD